MKKIVGVIGMSFFLVNCYSQQMFYTITGTISDKNNKLIESGYAIAMHTKDSSIIKGAFFMSGRYRLEGMDDDSLIIKLSSLGYDDVLKKIKNRNSDTLLNVGNTLLVNNNLLKEITVSAKVPLFENDGEKIKINVANTNLGSGGTAIDVLRKSPGIMVTGNNKVSIIGKGEPIIYIDGQRITSPEVLKNFPASEIQSIEVIRNPSAKYDATGSAVINIITKKANLQGYNGSVMQNYLYGKDLYLVNNIQFNMSKRKWSLNSSYGFNAGKSWESNLFTRKFTENDSTIKMNNSIYALEHIVGMHNYKLGINYQPDSLSTVGFNYNGFYNLTNYHIDNTNDIYLENMRQTGLATKSKQTYSLLNHNAGATYTHKCDTLGSELFAGVNYGNFISKNDDAIGQNVATSGALIEQQKRSRGNSNIKLVTANTDIKKLFNRNWSVDLGIKESYVNKTGGVRLDNLSEGNNWIPDSNYVNGFDFKENIFAGYTELRYKKGKFNSRIGLRSELTHSDGFSKILKTKVFSRNYINFFPSAFVGYNFPRDITAGITYSSRIRRPDYESLDPFINYIDSVSSERGNPFLLPDYTTSLEANLIVDEDVNLLTFGYNRTNGAITSVVEKLNDGSNGFVMTIKNIDYSESYSLGATLPWEEEWFTTANYFGLFWNTFTYRQSGQIVQNFKPMFYMYLYGELRLRKLFSLEVNYEYYGSGVDGIMEFKPFSMLSMSIKKTFFKNKLTCMFSANDMLRGYREWGKSRLPLYDIGYNSLYNTHNYSLQLTWNFGKLRVIEKSERSTNQEEYERIKMEK
jgi:iron complex outermembrane recepter protein